MTIEKTFQGAWRISTVYNGHYVSQQFFGYTKREAMKIFREHLKNLSNNNQ